MKEAKYTHIPMGNRPPVYGFEDALKRALERTFQDHDSYTVWKEHDQAGGTGGPWFVRNSAAASPYGRNFKNMVMREAVTFWAPDGRYGAEVQYFDGRPPAFFGSANE